MFIDSSFAGTALRDYETVVDWRHVMNFSAAIGDANEVYFDDDRPGGIISHPVYCAALTWPVTERIGDYIEAEDFPKELLATQVHFTENLKLYRPIIPGDRLTIRGRVDYIAPHRAGTYVIIRFEAADEKGKHVFVEHIGGLMRGVECRGAARSADGASGPPAVSEPPPQVISRKRTLHIDPLAPFVYDGCTNIFFPIHTSRKFARHVGLPGIILQGTATLAMAVTDIINTEAGGDPGRIDSLQCKFADMVIPGSDIVVQVEDGKIQGRLREIHFIVLNDAGRPAIRGGLVRIIL